MTLDVREWLEGLGLSEYAQAFDDNDIDEEVLVQLTAEDLKDVGVASVGHRRRLLSAISALDRPGETGDDVQPPGSKTSSPATAGTKAERRLLTVLFCDLVGSTALSRQLDPEDLRDIMRQYQDAVSGSVARYGGHVAKFLGDGVLAYFGWPQAHEDQAERAVRASLDAVHAVRSLKTVGDLKLDARVGISTGQVVVGDLVGTDSRDADTVIGETPNLAARLQAQAMAGQILLGPDTRRLIGASFDLVDAGPQVLKGFDTPVPAWRVRGEGAVDSRFAAAGHANLGPFVGRGTERQLLIDRWRLACSGEGQIMCLSGEAGIGKSRLLEQLLHDLEGERYFRLQTTPCPSSERPLRNHRIAALPSAAERRRSSALGHRTNPLPREGVCHAGRTVCRAARLTN